MRYRSISDSLQQIRLVVWIDYVHQKSHFKKAVFPAQRNHQKSAFRHIILALRNKSMRIIGNGVFQFLICSCLCIEQLQIPHTLVKKKKSVSSMTKKH